MCVKSAASLSVKLQYTPRKMSCHSFPCQTNTCVLCVCFRNNVWKVDQTFGDLMTLAIHPYKLKFKLHEDVYECVNMHA